MAGKAVHFGGVSIGHASEITGLRGKSNRQRYNHTFRLKTGRRLPRNETGPQGPPGCFQSEIHGSIRRSSLPKDSRGALRVWIMRLAALTDSSTAQLCCEKSIQIQNAANRPFCLPRECYRGRHRRPARECRVSSALSPVVSRQGTPGSRGYRASRSRLRGITSGALRPASTSRLRRRSSS